MAAPDHSPLLRVQNLSVRFGRDAKPAVENVSLTLSAERLGIVGESGSGKSTLGRAIMRLLPPIGRLSADTLMFEGASLLDKKEKHLRRLRGNRMALIMQDPRYSLNPVLPIGKQVAEAALLHLAVSKREAYALAAAMLERVRLNDIQRTMALYPHQISGGDGTTGNDCHDAISQTAHGDCR